MLCNRLFSCLSLPQLLLLISTPTTVFRYTPSLKQCTSRHVPFGVLRRDWLANATYEGTEVVRGFTCHKWAKLDFITYWADVETEHPVRWMFFTGMVQEVVSIGNHFREHRSCEQSADDVWSRLIRTS